MIHGQEIIPGTLDCATCIVRGPGCKGSPKTVASEQFIDLPFPSRAVSGLRVLRVGCHAGSLPNHVQQGSLSPLPEETLLAHAHPLLLRRLVLHRQLNQHAPLHPHPLHHHLVRGVPDRCLLVDGAGSDSLLLLDKCRTVLRSERAPL